VLWQSAVFEMVLLCSGHGTAAFAPERMFPALLAQSAAFSDYRTTPKSCIFVGILAEMDDIGALLAGLVKIFVFIIKVAVNVVAEILTTFLALFCVASLWKCPALFKCYESLSCDSDNIWEHRIKVIECFFSLLLDIACLPALFFSALFVWRWHFLVNIWSEDDGKWRFFAWEQLFWGLLDFLCVPALVLCMAR
jgi:hypothetical protein